MRLTAVRLAGFKSFVDPTTFEAPTNLTGIVGPNGCGKSNIIDAVRWVLGEGSAKVLRGEQMSDVIFSGSSSRKPVGTATVELVFDNSDGKVGGEFADYVEISVKRQVSRDGLSNYFLNGTRCRRKDIRDLFLGTGVGAHGYSVIEQGMISQVVEARPEQIRGYLEEAAGISKYKERRRETENRISHTRDNLDRLNDLREEVANHLGRLQRQARAAERYKQLKEEQRTLESRLLALQWQLETTRATEGRQLLAGRETELEAQLALQRAAETALEKVHQAQTEASEKFNEVQAALYAVGSDIARLEQTIQHQRELQAQQAREHGEVSTALKDLQQHMLLDQAQVDELARKLADLEPRVSEASAAETAAEAELGAAESAVQDWQERLEKHHGSFNTYSRRADQLRASLEVLDQRMAATDNRLGLLASEQDNSDAGRLAQELGQLGAECEQGAVAEQAGQAALEQARARHQAAAQTLTAAVAAEHALQSELASTQGRLQALESLQQAATQPGQAAWLKQQGLSQAPLLASQLNAEAGWERALETVLENWLDARLADGLAAHAAAIPALQKARLDLVDAGTGSRSARPGTLAEKVQAPDAIIALLNRIRVAEDVPAALAMLEQGGADSGSDDSVITRAGEWLGHGWARVSRAGEAGDGTLVREREIRKLRSSLEKLQARLQAQQAENAAARAAQSGLDAAVQSAQQALSDAHRARVQAEGRHESVRTRLADLEQRARAVAGEAETLRAQQVTDGASVRSARTELEQALEQMASAEQERLALDRQRGELIERRDQARQAASAARTRRHELLLEHSTCRASLDSLSQALQRMDTQVSQLQQRYLVLSEAVARARDPAEACRAEMDGLLERRVRVDGQLADARRQLQSLEADYRTQDAARQTALKRHQELRSELERARLQQQEIELNARNLQRQAAALGAEVEALAAELQPEDQPEPWQAELERLAERITRLEPVNLAAIQEFEEEAKRKEYLDAQYADLTEALATLEGAIAKIDRKTRTRFKDTYEAVNKGMQELYPRLFGGGHGYLELTGDDLLTTGVSIMARPPGKRVSSIHLLSGGEKALTAVAFVFAIFRLNPAPFCLLDEVDAPLDDANVGRFSELVKEMSESVQFIFVTHNKITMEMANQLSGVTMREPGVSRLVQVDLNEAARLAGSAA